MYPRFTLLALKVIKLQILTVNHFTIQYIMHYIQHIAHICDLDYCTHYYRCIRESAQLCNQTSQTLGGSVTPIPLC